MKVREKLFAMFGEYVSNIPASLTSSEMAGQATQEIEEQYASEGSLFMMQVCYFKIFFFHYLYYVICILLRLTSIMLFLYVGI